MECKRANVEPFRFQNIFDVQPCVISHSNTYLYLWDRSRRPEGGEWELIKISSEIQTVGLYPENHPSPQAFWPEFGIAMKSYTNTKGLERASETTKQIRSELENLLH